MNVRMIAKIAGCSASTVSRVLTGNFGNARISKALQDRIRTVCAELGYEPNVHASRLFSKYSRLIGLLTVGGIDLDDPNLSRFMSAVFHALDAHGYRLLLLYYDETRQTETDYASLFRRKEIDALLVWGACGDVTWLDELYVHHMPFLLAANKVRHFPHVVCDETAGMAAMTKHCIQRGAKKLVFLDGPDGDTEQRRKQGFLSAVGDLPHKIIPGDFTFAAGQNALPAIQQFQPDAVVCVNDKTAFGVITAAKTAGLRVPEDLLVTGADNIELSEYVAPTITTYDPMVVPCAERAVEILINHIEKHSPLESTIIDPAIHIRESA